MKIEPNWNSSFDSYQSFEKAVAGVFLIHSTKVLEPKIPGWSGWGTHDTGKPRMISCEHSLGRERNVSSSASQRRLTCLIIYGSGWVLPAESCMWL